MCDCYEHPCEVCGKPMPMHIADFAFPRDCFRVWCGKHVKKAPAGAVVFTMRVSRRRMAILGPGSPEFNHPNWGMETDQEVVK